MGSYDFEAGVLWGEGFSDCEGDDGGEVTSEEVLLACLQLPVLNLF
jgi:hypothetical protein